MKSEDIFNAVTELRDDQIRAGEKKLRAARPAIRRRIGAIAALLAVVVLAGVVAGPWLTSVFRGEESAVNITDADPKQGGASGSVNPAPYTLARAVYPRMAPYPNESNFMKNLSFDEAGYQAAWDAWMESRNALRSDTDYTVGLASYLKTVIPSLLTDAGNENRVVSPLNIYMALAMLAESSAGKTREELLTLLNAPDISALRSRAKALWQSNYSDDGRLTELLAASIWLRDDTRYQQDTVTTLSTDYYSSVFHGRMGDPSYNSVLQGWMNDQTKNLLADQIQGIELDSQTAFALITTVYYKAAWASEFWRSESRTFHGPAGEQACKFMLDTVISEYYKGDGFTAVGKDLVGGGMMYFLLPDENLTPEALLSREGALSFLIDDTGRESTNHQTAFVNLAVPSFDVCSQIELKDRLKDMGIQSAFDIQADFSQLIPVSETPTVLSSAQHGARLKVDEKGVTGAAYTVLATEGTIDVVDLDEVELTLDRPFLFAVTNNEGLPIFVGTVHAPTP